MRLYGLHASVLAVGIAAQTEAATASDSGALDPLQTAKWATRLFQDQNSTTTPETLQPLVDGFIPEWLQGSLVRVGPAVWRLPKRSALHSFDGLAKVSRWSFAGGANQTGAAFTDRFVESDVYHASIQDDSYPRGVTFGPFEPPFSPFQAKVGDDNNNVNVWTADGGRVFALTDGATIIELDAQSLKTIGHMNSTGPLAGGASSCAHGLTDISAGAIAAGPTMLNFMSVPDGASGKLNVSAFRVGSLNSSSQTGPTRDLVGFGTVQFPISDWPYMHSFARTASHFVLTAFPAVLDFVALGLGKPLTECIQWRGDDAGQDDAGRMQKSPGISSADKSSAAVPTRFAVFAIPPPGSEKIDTQPLAVIEDLPAFFSWHNVNTFESSGSKGKIRNQPNPDSAEPFSLAEHPTIVVDMVAHPKFGPDIIADKSFAWLKNSAEPEAYNSTFPWSGSLRRVIINVNNSSSTFMDLPLVDAAGNEYVWSVLFVCGTVKPTKDAAIQGWRRRTVFSKSCTVVS